MRLGLFCHAIGCGFLFRLHHFANLRRNFSSLLCRRCHCKTLVSFPLIRPPIALAQQCVGWT